MGQATIQGQGLRGQRIVRFGPFELSLDTGELRKHGIRVRLQGKPFHILNALLEEPGRVVTREELRSRLWAADTFVDFESGLNTAVNRLRIALGDSAENPIYIETLTRLGYRFVAPVEALAAPRPLAPVQQDRLRRTERAETALETPHSVPTARPNHLFALSRRRWPLIGAAILSALVLAATAILLLTRLPRAQPSFHQVTFRKGFVTKARFTRNGGNIIYSAEWNGAPSRVFLTSPVSPEARDLGLEKAWLASLSPTAELALFVKPRDSSHMVLERVPLHGGAPSLISDKTTAADWGPDGNLALVTDQGSVSSLEFPAGRNVYVSRGYITDPRVSPQGDQVAFLEHPIFGDDAGRVMAVNSSGEAHVLSSGWASALGLAWHPSGREVWFTATRSGANRAVMAVDLRGHVRQISRVPGDLQLQDIDSSGKVLVARTTQRITMFFGNLNDNSEQDISWFDWSRAVAISADGKSVLFDETGEGGGKQYSVYLYKAQTHSAERLSEGRAMDLSADGQWALTQDANDPTKLTVVSVNAAQRKRVSPSGIAYRWAKFFPDGKEILSAGAYPNQSPGIYRQTLPNHAPKLVAAGLQLNDAVIDPTGQIAVGCDGSHPVVLNLSGGTARSIRTSQCVSPTAFIDPQTVLATHQESGSFVMERLDLKSGRLTPYRRFKPRDSTGTMYTSPPRIAKDLQTFVFSRMQDLSDLFVVSGWK